MAAISLIVPVYKVEAYLGRCVDSILAQTFSDYELILVDDGSPDNCGRICEDYASRYPHIHVLHQANGGLSAARNTGIDWAFANSDSQWLAFIDSDDWVAPDYLEQLYRAATENRCLISACGFCQSEGEAIPSSETVSTQILNAEEYYCQDGSDTTVAVCKLYHKSLFSQLRYPVGKLHEDEFTTYRAVFAAGSVAAVPALLYAYYCNPQSITRSQWSGKRMDALEAVEQQIAFAFQNGYQRFWSKAIEQYLYGTHEQLKLVEETPEFWPHQKTLRKKLRHALKLGRDSGVFPLTWENLWAYEEAYPCKPIWWLVSKMR